MFTPMEIPSSQRDTSLPMIVNLRGDEDIVASFSYDADQAMAYLGIKRSRLTQISGRELRVGRIRRDRYLRPVYREIDLRDYQEWTRATATHQSSSRAIEQAIDSLDDRFNDLFVVLQEKWQRGQADEQKLLESQLGRLQLKLTAELRRLNESGEELRLQQDQSTHRALHQLHASQSKALERLNSVLAELEAVRLRLDLYHQDIRELVNSGLLLRKELQDLVTLWRDKAAAEAERELRLQSNLQKQLQDAISESQENLLLTITKILQDAELRQLAQAKQLFEERSAAEPEAPSLRTPVTRLMRRAPRAALCWKDRARILRAEHKG